ncbi:MAG: radical SAM protein [Alphaproteobacteria bacterium]|nr:radical SAM protein [Alphaproteobacteria bacterium]
MGAPGVWAPSNRTHPRRDRHAGPSKRLSGLRRLGGAPGGTVLSEIRRRIADEAPIDRTQAAWLFENADDDTLSELATAVRDRFHPQGRATWLIMAIINYTNVCVAKCDYCAFYTLPNKPGGYLLSQDQVFEKIDALTQLGGTLVAFNGGFHPKLRITDYAELFANCHARYPHLTFFETTVAEFMFACKVSKVSYAEGARILKAAGTEWITGGGAEVLDEAFRKRHSPLKYRVEDFYDAQRAVLEAGIGSTATMVIGFDETLEERLNHLERLRDFQSEVGGLPSFLCWTYKPYNTELGGGEVSSREYLRWLAICRIYLHNIPTIRTSVLTQNERALEGLRFGANDFDIPTEDEVTQKAGAVIHHEFERILGAARAVGYEPVQRGPLARPALAPRPAIPGDGAQPSSAR